jgi:hypothetical protein
MFVSHWETNIRMWQALRGASGQLSGGRAQGVILPESTNTRSNLVLC